MDTVDLPVLIAIVALLALAALVLVVLRIRRQQRQKSTLIPPTVAVPHLRSLDGLSVFPLEKLDESGVVVGRSRHGVDLIIDKTVAGFDGVSERHARIYYDSRCGNVIVEDLGSEKGVFINGRRAPRKNLLRDGWTIGLGSLMLVYRDGESDTGPLG